jgi:hypothetical protein
MNQQDPIKQKRCREIEDEARVLYKRIDKLTIEYIVARIRRLEGWAEELAEFDGMPKLGEISADLMERIEATEGRLLELDNECKAKGLILDTSRFKDE